MQLSQQPQTLYRYTRMNWQKPYLELHAQSLTGTRLLSQLWTDTFSAWQQLFTGMNTYDKMFKPKPAPSRPLHKTKHEITKHHYK